ncbi:helicase SNF2 [Marinobacterium iners]|uniref:helicase-related protein n=1 Tax=Marinobacterium iners TaxID=48076 RepID=UPI001A8DAD4E|nr:helicase-related protein [Marinobacterium iners]QSR35235.1 helicase SNF2 [Marinobacterium iners]
MNAPTSTPAFNPGSIVRARDREWVVLPESKGSDLYLRALGSGDDDRVRLLAELEQIEQALFPAPNPADAREGSQQSGQLLRDSMLLKLRAGAGPFRAIGNLAFEPRAYQLVPLLMALRQEVVRLLIADDVGIGKTIEAGLILRELIDRGEVKGFTVLCPPHLCEQWQEELSEKFHLQPVIVSRHTAARLERGLLQSESLFQYYPYTVVSLDYIKSNRRRDEFLTSCPDFVIVDEAHTCAQGNAQGRHQRYALLKGLSAKASRNMLLLTATPHSGDEQAFRNLLGLLDPEFATLVRLDDARNPIRKRLALHMVQRRRQDIAEWRDNTQFPDRETGETAYRMQGDWMALFQDVIDYARELVERAEQLDQFQQRLHWWAALALLRCISSSPAAAVRTLQNRIDRSIQPESNAAQAIEMLDELGSRTILDTSDESQDDLEPSAQLEDVPLLQHLISRAESLQGPKADPKLKQLIASLKPMLNDGYRPVIFCRYIPTAHYLAEHLGKAFKAYNVECVTGELHPSEREDRVEALAERDGSPILVATDCLSEGINLQEHFDAIVHYDLAWNPTRHEQREGRVDRFGQRTPVVKALMLYGDNNPVDGAVLKVIIRKAEAIRKALGVSVPMPEDENRVTQAIMQTVLLTRGMDSGMSQMGLGLEFDGLDDLEQQVDVSWDSAREKARRNRTIFAQQAIHPDEVLPEWQRMQEVLGDQNDVQRFITQALSALRAPLQPHQQHFRMSWNELPLAIRERLESHGIRRIDHLGFELPLPRDVTYIHRSHPLVTVLADELAERALESDDSVERPARRAGAITTREVEQRAILALLRLRTNLVVEREGNRREMLAEEAVTVLIEGNQPPRQLTTQEAVQLFNLAPSQNTLPEVRERAVRQALERLQEQQSVLDQIARDHGQQLLQDHRRVRDSERDGRGNFQVNPQLPADILGVYVLMPEVAF